MSTLRKIATPLTIGTFVLMGTTGTLMFFHAETPLNKFAHEYIGLGMIAAVVLHVILNWRAFTLYFKRPLAMGVMGVFVLALGLSFLPLTGQEQPRPDLVAIQLVTGAPISTLGPMLGTDTDGVIARLQAADIQATADQTLAQLSGDDLRAAAQLLVRISAP
ncbi:DUF4405 domain-containing protein [Thalassovita taeanensis]|uniref:Flavinylation-associated cytochrome domain-containing protein n=1 Tax=Thalassovita taeanensis TaxID=657014 RepID=A0A1H9BBY6_9RHOB|nr:DUF4405 domain-containing protein [Thalassovita taeanensis]SEP86221.1 protein of unknown function [Thalassovita taeanensis]